ncbi:PhoH family protein [Zhihengliuella salsuginis]|uniref:PhoH-like protein n=1 Tax=Zhihengliuella salsuginis TaxID=578222 RepID=A0ABQ3GDE2_9MICC|nr:PhoH family protein [Zhihengliuella salsuginis]GHD02110.1 phosphate starvation protein PhoH [Zhihengliuella salsuginis]
MTHDADSPMADELGDALNAIPGDSRADEDRTRVAEPALITFASTEEMVASLGAHDEVLRILQNVYPHAALHVRGNELTVTGEPGDAGKALRVVNEARALAAKGTRVNPQLVEQLVRMVNDQRQSAGGAADVFGLNILSGRGKSIRPKTVNQKSYVDAIDDHTIIFGIGPAGTGKTFLAMAKAVQALQAKEVSRIILTRPAVEAGEKLGFLPGTLTDKIDPYLRPLYDALHDMIDPETIPRLIAAGTIEVAPLAYMRGRTLNDAFIILDEAQNTTPEQMKMFLTRLGFGSKIVVTGDVTQVDLPGGTRSGLRVVSEILEGVDDIEFRHLGAEDVVRHRLVSDIVTAYETWSNRTPGHSDAADRRRRQARGAKAPGRRRAVENTEE